MNRETPSTSIFISGATGVIGRKLVPRLVALGHRVTAVGRSAERRARLEAQGARAVDVDLFDASALARALAAAQAEVVVNLATHIPTPPLRMMLPWAWRENDHVRREGSAALAAAAAAAGVRRLVQESFAPIYESRGDEWIDESAPVRPAPNNRTTLDAERSALRFGERRGEGVVLRFAGFYGPDAQLAALLGSVRRGWAPLPGPGEAYWSSLAHEDAATAVVAAATAPGLPGGIYNVGDDEPLARRDLAATLAAVLGVAQPRPLPSWLPRLGGAALRLLARSQRISNAKLRRATGWSPRWPSAREGLPAAIRELRRDAEGERRAAPAPDPIAPADR